MANILYLTYDGLSDPLGQSQIIPYLEGLSSAEQKIHIVSFEKAKLFKVAKNGITDKLNKAKIEWHPLIYHKSPPVLSTLWDLFQLWRNTRKLHNRFNFKVIHCRSYITSMVGLAMKRKYKTKFLFDMRGFWADERVDGGLWNIKNPMYKLIYDYFKRQERYFLQNADAIISLTNNAKNEIKSWKNINIKAPVYVIPCCVDLTLFNEDPVENTEQIRKKIGLTSTDFVLTYLGAIGTWYMLDEMLDFFKILLKEKTNAKFLFITTEKPSIIQHIAQLKQIPDFSYIIHKAERKEVPNLLKITNVAIFFIKPAYSKKASSPTKQGELMAMGIPIICNAGIGDTDEIIRKFNSGKIVEKFSQSGYLSIVDDIEKVVKLNKNSIVDGAHQIYSLEQGINKYAYIYDQLIFELVVEDYSFPS